jgi:hypothetical protein
MTENRVELRIPTPILDCVNLSLSKLVGKNLVELTQETNTAIELGVRTDSTAATAEATVQQARKSIKAVNGIRLEYTRPIDAGKKLLMDEVARLLKPLVDANKILDEMVLERKRKIDAQKLKAQQEADEARRIAEEKARKEEERRRNISLARGGTGDVKPVVAEIPIQPTQQLGMRSTTRMRSIPDLESIEKAVQDGVRDIDGVSIYPVWKFEVIEAKKIPTQYRRDVRG